MHSFPFSFVLAISVTPLHLFLLHILFLTWLLFPATHASSPTFSGRLKRWTYDFGTHSWANVVSR